MTRLGLAVARPRVALALADRPEAAGRAGSDLVALLLAAVLAVHTRELVAAAWLGAVIDAGLGVRAAVDTLARAVTVPLAALVGAGLILWLAAGRRRALGRDFDLACVAIVPLVIVELAASLLIAAFELHVPPVASWAVTAVGAAWAAAIILRGVQVARRRGEAAPEVDERSESGGVGTPEALPLGRGRSPRGIDEATRRTGRRAGAAVLALAGALLAVHVVWVVTHLDWLRPMQDGDPMPAFALPLIVEDGAPGEVVRSEDLAGTVIVLDFWAPWCGPCLHAMPALSALAARHPDGAVRVLSIALEQRAESRAIFDDGHYAQLLVADAGGASERFGVSAIPHLVVVDRAGVVRLVARGDGQLRRTIALAEQLALH